MKFSTQDRPLIKFFGRRYPISVDEDSWVEKNKYLIVANCSYFLHCKNSLFLYISEQMKSIASGPTNYLTKI